MKKILLIDNYDSFTYNLVQQIQSTKHYDIDVKRNDEIAISKLTGFDILIISPGPKTPADAGISNDLIHEFYNQVPVLGVCLGMQCINEVFGGKTVNSPLPFHGKTSLIEHNERDIFENIPQNLEVARYHSLITADIPDCIEVAAWTEDKIPMAIKHKKHPVYGVQFHPESFMTEFGSKIMENFLNLK